MQNVLGKKKKTHAPHTYNIRNRGVGGSSLGTQRYSTKHKKHPFDNWKILQLSCLNLKKPSSITCWLKTKHINCTCLIESISSVWYSDSNYTKYYAVVLNYKALLPSAGVYPSHFFELGKLVENILWKLLYPASQWCWYAVCHHKPLLFAPPSLGPKKAKKGEANYS